jgi:hypothetical protein
VGTTVHSFDRHQPPPLTAPYAGGHLERDLLSLSFSLGDQRLATRSIDEVPHAGISVDFLLDGNLAHGRSMHKVDRPLMLPATLLRRHLERVSFTSKNVIISI